MTADTAWLRIGSGLPELAGGYLAEEGPGVQQAEHVTAGDRMVRTHAGQGCVRDGRHRPVGCTEDVQGEGGLMDDQRH